jgi:phosphopantothenoylcysteine decarboxylase/phosphopantothenate--cysteine ligase
MTNILLIITGSIACYKSMDLIRLLKKNNYNVTCILTKSAQKFITPLLCSSLTNNNSYTDLFNADDEVKMGHIKLSRENDLIVVAPASANFIAKLANGYADDLASNCILASNKKIIIAPAMNERMWLSKQNQSNLTKIINSNIKIIQPETDILACNEFGIGKMASPETIYNKIYQIFENKNKLKDRNIIITGGSTYEPIDPVRFIGNHSSGKQAIQIAEILDEMGANLTFIACNIKHPINIDEKKIIRYKNCQEVMNYVKKNLKNCDVFIGCAAISDFKVKNYSNIKIKKDNQEFNLQLTSNPDIIKYVGNCKNRPKIVIGFAAESNNIKQNAQKKLIEKNLDFIIANDIDYGNIFGNDKSKSMIISRKSSTELKLMTKKDLAKLITEKILISIKNIT